MFDFIKRKLAQKDIASLALQHSKKVSFLNYEHVKNVLLLSYVEDIEHIKAFKQAASMFHEQNRKVTLVVFYPKKELADEMLIENNINFLCLKDTDWKGLPKGEMIPFVENTTYDLVVDFTQHSTLQMAWLAYKSKASLIVSGFQDDAFADFTVKIPSHKDETFLAEQIIFYLRTIKSK